MTVDLDVVVLPAFDDSNRPDGETAPWRESYDLANELEIDGTVAPLQYADCGLGVLKTGIGKAAAATTTTALLGAEGLDLSNALFLSVACAGAPPTVPVGSVVISDCVVDWDSKYRLDPGSEGRSISVNPYTKGHSVYELDEELVSETRALSESVELASPASRGPGDGDRAPHREPEVRVGANLCGDELWHGPELAGHAEWLVDQHTSSPYLVTAMEDAGTAMALERYGRLDQYCCIRGVANHDRAEAESSAETTDLVDDDGIRLSVGNAAAVAGPLVEARLS